MINLVLTPVMSQIRAYVDNPDGYANRDPYQAIITVQHIGDKAAYLSGAMGKIDRNMFDAAVKLLGDIGITEVTIERRGKIRSL